MKIKVPRRPFVSSLCWVPLKHVEDIDALKEELTIEYDAAYAAPTDGDFSGSRVIEAFDLSRRGYIGVPRYFGLSRFGRNYFADRTVDPGNIFRDHFAGCKITPRDEQQRAYFGNLARACEVSGPVQYYAKARTGSGKTAADLALNIRLGIPTLVLVHTNSLKEQWLGDVSKRRGMRFFYGEEFVNDYVGIAQQNVCDYEGKAVVVGLMQSVVRGRYPKEFYNYFGRVVYDEIHLASAPVFSRLFGMFPARIQGGMTATPREDVLHKLAMWQFGPVSIVSQQEVMRPICYDVRFKKTYGGLRGHKLNMYSEASALSSLSDDPDRNLLLAAIIVDRGIRRNRRILVLSDRIEQLQTIADMVKASGEIDDDKIGLFTGKIYTGRWTLRTKTAEVGARGRAVPFNDTHKSWPTRAAAVAKGKACVSEGTAASYTVEKEWYKPKAEHYNAVESNAQVIFATYGIFGTGNDIDTLDMGVEALPRSKLDQPLGRILRIKEGKETPEWYSIRDILTIKGAMGQDEPVEFLLKRTRGRHKSFARQKATVKTIKNPMKLLSGTIAKMRDT